LVTTNSTNGVTTYTLAGSSYPYGTGETIYYISGSDQFGNQFSDAIKISPVKILDGLAVSLTNDNASLPARSTGFVESGSFVLSSGSVSVKVGNEIIAHSNGLSANNTFDIVSAIATNVQTGSLNYSTTDYFISRLDADSGSLNLTIRYKDGAGDTSDTTKLVTYSKAKIGTPNVVVAVSPSAQSISSNSRGSGSATPGTLTITALEGGTSRFTSIGTPTYTNGLGGTISTNTITFTSNASSMSADTGQLTIPVNYTDSEGISGTKNIIATISKAKTAVPNVEVSVSPQAQSVTALADGSSPSTPTSLTIKALEGGATRLTTVSATGTNVTVGTIVYDPVSGTPKNYATIPLSAVAADNASVAITINYTDSEGTAGTKSLTATISKAKKGTNGDNGNPGADGKRTATGLLYYQLAAATAPTTPTATSYTFSTNTFAGLTANWALGAPTFAAGNSNKYWYSTYTAVETTAGGNTAVPTFTTVTQAIGFTGLVTFTSTDKITDGTNTSNIVPSGSITNHIGGANVTTINGGKISTGTITSTKYTLLGDDTLASGSYMGGGTIFNLDNSGSIRSKNFYITPEGNAFFRGNISAGSGDIGGWLINSTSLSKGNISLNSSIEQIQVGTGDGRVLINTETFANRFDPNTTAKSISIGPGGIILKGAHTTGTPQSYIYLLQEGDAARQVITSTNLGVEPLAIYGHPTGNSSAAVVVYNGGLQARNFAFTAGGTVYPGTGNGGYAIQSVGNFYTDGTGTFTGDVTANTSDKRLKTNIKNIDSPLEKISKINGVYFNWNEKAKELIAKDTEKREVGFIAQEIEDVLPEIIKPAPFDVTIDENVIDRVIYKSKSGENYLTIQYEKIVPLLVECIKELKLEIEELKRNR
jgi:hypothetical protein